MADIIDLCTSLKKRGDIMPERGDFVAWRGGTFQTVHCVILSRSERAVQYLWLTPGHEVCEVSPWEWRHFRRVRPEQVTGTLRGLTCTFLHNNRRQRGSIISEKKNSDDTVRAVVIENGYWVERPLAEITITGKVARQLGGR